MTKIRDEVEALKRKKLAQSKVISLADYRDKKNLQLSSQILVVDDDEIMREALKRIITSASYTVDIVADGIELSKALEKSHYELIFLDVNLPWVDGFELCRILKAHKETSQIPIVFVSARNTKEDIELGFEVGCSDYLTKPFDVSDVLSRVSEYLKLAL